MRHITFTFSDSDRTLVTSSVMPDGKLYSMKTTPPEHPEDMKAFHEALRVSWRVLEKKIVSEMDGRV